MTARNSSRMNFRGAYGPEILPGRISLLVTILLAACASPPAPPQTSATPQRIVSLIPAVTETLFAIGAGPKVVGVSTFDTWPPEVTTRTRVGGLIDPDTERILSLQPDLVFVYGSQSDLIEQLQAARIPTETYRHGGIDDVIASVRSVAARVGLEGAGERIAQRITRALADARARHAAGRRPSVLIVFGREDGALRGTYASGGVGFIHDMVEAAGGRNVFADVRRESVQASLESILERAPEIILEIRAPSGAARSPAELIAPWETASSLRAVRDGRVHAIIDERLVVPGPRLAEGMLLIERMLWP